MQYNKCLKGCRHGFLCVPACPLFELVGNFEPAYNELVYTGF